MSENIKLLRQRQAESKKKLRGMLDQAIAQGRDLNETEDAAYETEKKALVAIDKSIEREEELQNRERRTSPIDDANAGAAAAAGSPVQKGHGFKSLGEQLLAVRRAVLSHGRDTDQRLFAGPAGANEAVPAEGGFLVPKDYSDELLMRTYQTGEIVSKCRKIPLSGKSNGIKINAIDEDSRADGSRWGGVQAYWQNEAGTVAAKKPKFRKVEMQLNKLMAFCYATDELLDDAAALGAVISESFAEEMVFKVEEAIVNGTGAGQPLGFTNSGAVIQVAKDGGDSGATVSTADILAMWARLWTRCRANAVWFIDQSVEPKLYPLTLGSGSLAQILLYTPPGTNGNKYGSLFGRPVIPIEHAQVLGTPGDIMLADMSQYTMIDKDGVKQDTSMHVNFLSDEQVFRFTYRVDGQTWWKKPLTPKNGGPTQGPFVTLATRS